MLLKVLGILFGVLLTAGGIHCAMVPLDTVTGIALIVPVFLGASLLLAGIDRFLRWTELKREGEKDGLLFAEGILGILGGLIMLFSGIFQASMTLALLDMIPWLTSALVLSFGILRIIRAFRMREINKLLVLGNKVHLSWGWELAAGILLVIIGILSALNPLTTLVSIGIVIAADIITTGITLIASAIAF